MGVKELLDNNNNIEVTEESVLELEDMSEDVWTYAKQTPTTTAVPAPHVSV